MNKARAGPSPLRPARLTLVLDWQDADTHTAVVELVGARRLPSPTMRRAVILQAIDTLHAYQVQVEKELSPLYVRRLQAHDPRKTVDE